MVNTVTSAADRLHLPAGSTTNPPASQHRPDPHPGADHRQDRLRGHHHGPGRRPVGYTITVTDTGQTPYTGATVTDSLSGILGATVYNGDAAATAGTVSYASPDLTWTGNLNPGDSATITYTVTVDNPDTGDHDPHRHRSPRPPPGATARSPDPPTLDCATTVRRCRS